MVYNPPLPKEVFYCITRMYSRIGRDKKRILKLKIELERLQEIKGSSLRQEKIKRQIFAILDRIENYREIIKKERELGSAKRFK